MKLSLEEFLGKVWIPKQAKNIGYGLSCQMDGRTTEMRIALGCARDSNPGCAVTYAETQWSRDEGESIWYHTYWVDDPGKPDNYPYQVEAIKIDPVVLVAAAFYDLAGRHYMVVATYQVRTGHFYRVLKDNEICPSSQKLS